jgi:SAM-dependent methyltransferase
VSGRARRHPAAAVDRGDDGSRHRGAISGAGRQRGLLRRRLLRLTPVTGASDWDRRYAGAGDDEPEPNEHVAAILAGLTPGRALDLGCGRGRHTLWLARHGWRVVAVDFSAVALAQARRYARGLDVDWRHTDLADHRPEPPLDLAVLAFVHEAADRRRALIGAVAPALAPGGTLLLAGFHPDHLRAGLDGGPREATKLYDPEVLATR